MPGPAATADTGCHGALALGGRG